MYFTIPRNKRVFALFYIRMTAAAGTRSTITPAYRDRFSGMTAGTAILRVRAANTFNSILSRLNDICQRRADDCHNDCSNNIIYHTNHSCM